MTVTVVPDTEHLEAFAVAGTVEAASIDVKHNGVPEKAAAIENVQVVAAAIAQEPAIFVAF